MGALKGDNFVQEVCDLKHKTVDMEISDIKEVLEQLVNPTSGHIAAAKIELEKKIDKLEAKFNGLIMFLVTTGTGIVISLVAEQLKKLGK